MNNATSTRPSSLRTLGVLSGAAACTLAITIVACGSAPAATPPPATTPTVLTPDSEPVCGDFGRPYVTPQSDSQFNQGPFPEGLGRLDERESRIVRAGPEFLYYRPEEQALLQSGRTRVGLDEFSVYLSSGIPAFYWNTTIDGANCRVMLYSILGESSVDTAIYTCDGTVALIEPVEPALPCWRLQEVAPRAIERAEHFDAMGVESQWSALHGLLQRGQSTDDVWVAFGDPYRRGMEAREDGTNASSHVYLDQTGDAYAAYLTFVDDELRGWRFPPDRRLTPEAEQRRLEAMETRMVDQMRAMEARAIQRHNEEIAHLNDIQARQTEMIGEARETRARVREAVETQIALAAQAAAERETRNQTSGGSGGGNASGGSSGGSAPPRGCKYFSYNGESFSDNHGTAMGTPCPCPEGYACFGPVSRCMPVNPQERCSE